MLEHLLQGLFKYRDIDYGYSDQWLLFDVVMDVPNIRGKRTERIDYVRIIEGRSNTLKVYLYNDVEDFMDCYKRETEYYRKFELSVLLTALDREGG